MFYKQEQIFLRVFFLVTKCEIHEHPQTGTITQGYNPSATFYIQFVTCESQKKMEPKCCYACADLLFIANLQERRVYERECCGIFLHHNCVDLQHLKSECVSCDECPNWLLLKTLVLPDLVVIDDQAPNYEQVRQKELCIICIEQETFGDKLLITRCCQQSAHTSCLKRFYRVPEMCSSQHFSDEIAARLYNETCFVCRSSPASIIQLDELVVENLIPEVNPLANAQRISDANVALGTFWNIFNFALSDLLSTCRTGNLRCTFAIGKYRTSDGDFHKSMLDLPRSRLQPCREFQKTFSKCTQKILEN